MKLGIVVNSSWNLINFREGLLKALAQKHDVLAVIPDNKHSATLEAWGVRCVIIPMHSKGTNPVQDLQLLYRLYRLYRKEKLQAVLHFTIKPNIYGSLAARWAKIPAINNVTGLGTVFLNKKISSQIALELYKWAFQKPRLVFFQNPDDRKLFLKMGLVRPSRTGLLPGSGINTSYFSPSPPPQNTTFRFLLVARLLYDKGICEYVGAARLLRAKGYDTKLQLLGRLEPQKGLGISAEVLRQWENEGLVEYLGVTDDVRPYLQKADCVVLPSYREGTPRTLLEAGCLGRPIIATDVPGCRETVQDGYNGYLCQVRDAQDLADKMMSMIGLSPKARAKMGKNSRTFMENRFDERLVIEKYKDVLALIEELTERHRAVYQHKKERRPTKSNVQKPRNRKVTEKRQH